VKWHQVLQAASDLAAATPALANIYGADGFRYAGTSPYVTPALEHQLVADGEDELWAVCTIQFDQWCRTMEDLLASEHQLRLLFHVETQRDYAGMPCWSQYNDGETLASPDRDGAFGRAIRFRMSTLRERYAPNP